MDRLTVGGPAGTEADGGALFGWPLARLLERAPQLAGGEVGAAPLVQCLVLGGILAVGGHAGVRQRAIASCKLALPVAARTWLGLRALACALLGVVPRPRRQPCSRRAGGRRPVQRALPRCSPRSSGRSGAPRRPRCGNNVEGRAPKTRGSSAFTTGSMLLRVFRDLDHLAPRSSAQMHGRRHLVLSDALKVLS